MATAVQFGGKARGLELDPALKDFLDRVVVPILVREYLAELESEGENGLALLPEDVTKFAAKDSASAEGVL